MIKKTIGLGIASLMVIMMTSVPSFAGKVLLKVPVWFPTTLPALGTSPAWVAKHINAIGGDLTMKTYEPKKLVPPKEMLEAVSKGQVNA
ncbi:MAG: C4-dicarboxylate ABC transporter, partial [Alphaproteobacteria bacterium]|nr:C4-dicarboxylate ABC transporter [Alphaproteobacteria bacterium]